MRIFLVHPNYHSGGAEIAGNWPPAWVTYISGALKSAGFLDIRFIDAMTDHITDDALQFILRAEQPDAVLCTAITPAIYNAQETMALVKKIHPNAVTLLGGIHGTFMYGQVLNEAPEIDYIMRGEGEEIVVCVVKAIVEGTLETTRDEIRGIAFRRDGQPFATTPHPPIQELDSLTPDWAILDWSKYIYIPLNCRVAVPNFARGCPFTCPFTCSFCSQWKFWRQYRTRDPKKFVELCEELVQRDLGIHWGINTRVTDILRDEELLPLYRKAGLVHVSLGTEAAAQLELDRFNKEIKVEQSIGGLENETPETLAETYAMAQDWKPDLVNWNCYTPWPFSDLFQDLGDKVEVRDYAKCNFVTPIIQPDVMTRDEVLAGVLKIYGRFSFKKATDGYLWDKDPYRRTADYLIAHSIPRLAQLLMCALPARLALRTLLAGIMRHPWTFAGTATVHVAHSRGAPLRLVLTHCPMGRALHEPVPTCHFYAGTLEQLLHRLVSPMARVHEVACEATGAAGCEFALAVR